MQLQQRAGERVASASEVPECQREFQNQAKVVVKWRVWKLKRPLKGLWACPAPLHALAALAALAGPDDNEFGLHLCEQLRLFLLHEIGMRLPIARLKESDT